MECRLGYFGVDAERPHGSGSEHGLQSGWVDSGRQRRRRQHGAVEKPAGGSHLRRALRPHPGLMGLERLWMARWFRPTTSSIHQCRTLPPCGVPIQRCRRLFGPPNASIRQRFPRDSLNLSSPLTAQSLGRLCPKSPKPAGAGNGHRFPAPRWWRCSVPYGGHTSHTSPASFPACLRRLQAKDGFHLNRQTGSRPGAGATRSRMSGPAPSWWGHGPPGSEPLPPAE